MVIITKQNVKLRKEMKVHFEYASKGSTLQ